MDAIKDTRLTKTCASWNRFWFTPSDPTVLAAIRIITGIITFYTLVAYSFDLQEIVGENAWFDLQLRSEQYRDAPIPNVPFEWSKTPDAPLPLPADAAEQKRINDYFRRWGVDPRTQMTTGLPVWSVWFHVTDPFWMTVVHNGFLACCLLFTIGCGTRLTSAATWFGIMCYIHRAPASLYGADTMMAILLLYLMIGPSGAALSVDRWFVCWRAGRRGLAPPPLVPSVSANLTVRLIQVHTCIIYLMAGLSKLQGLSWWTGDAPWGTLANFEYAPMQNPVYVDFLRFLAKRRWLYELTISGGALGTLAFEIAYPFVIWRPAFRTLWLWLAVFFHGVIGMFMGLRTFSILMLAFNLAFVSPLTVRWVIGKLSRNPPTKRQGDLETRRLGDKEPAVH